MNEAIYDLLENRGLLRDDEVCSDAVDHLDYSAIVECAEEAAVITSADQMPRERTMFVHTAAMSLGGGRAPCSGIGCRSQRARELAEFATIYSDRVYISNFLSEHQSVAKHDVAIGRMREELKNDIALLSELRPLVEAGRIVPVTFPGVHCPQCFVGKELGAEADRKLEAQLKQLNARMLRELRVDITRKRGHFRVRFSGPDDLLEHGERRIGLKRLPDELSKFPEVIEAINRGGEVTLDAKVLEDIEIHRPLVADLLGDIVFDVMSTQALGTSFVTDRRLHVEMLEAMSEDAEQEERNRVIERHLTTIIPFLSDVDTTELLGLRQREEEAFVLFRNAVNASVREVIAKKGSFAEKDARQLYGDVLAPGLARLDQKVRAAKKSSGTRLRREGVAAAGALTFGTYSGLLSSSLIAAAKAFGLTKVVQDLTTSALSSPSADEVLRSEELFFLWKVRELRPDNDGFMPPAV